MFQMCKHIKWKQRSGSQSHVCGTIYFTGCLSFFSVAVIKYSNKGKVEEEGFIWLTMPGYISDK